MTSQPDERISPFCICNETAPCASGTKSGSAVLCGECGKPIVNINLKDFVDEIHRNENLRKEVQLAGKSVSAIESKKLKLDVATELTKVAARHGYVLHVDEFFPNGDTAWLQTIPD